MAMDNYNYPPGADDKRAPWNEDVPEMREFDTTVYISLSKAITLRSDDYVMDGDAPDFSEVDGIDCWKTAKHKTPLELLRILHDKCIAEAAYHKEMMKHEIGLEYKKEHMRKLRECNRIAAECDGWEEYDLMVE